eukprot:gnl/MRDRNA2_/MRDRNA2_120296_c0_seq1.p1 gnl/MRDRNA2_/MRDRNA2_120296_c0~~gnl/MRDRNA2_/MRDRNA2_120296_c0_seq1.p1  ORF type:complete len:214 (-),score=6.07 gnl/MRDRNA2_/MRDRNA2_120296_c0_seq1:89-730(-)
MPPQSSVPESWRKPVLSTWYYGPCCFAYSVFGIFVGVFSDELERRYPIPWPWKVQAMLLILQGLASFLADFVSLSRSSWWHLIDLLMATTLTSSFACIFMLFDMDAPQRIFGVTGLLTGMGLFYLSRSARKKNWGPLSYARFHTAWHLCYPSTGIIWLQYTTYFVDSSQVRNQSSSQKSGTNSWLYLGVLAVVIIIAVFTNLRARPGGTDKNE